VLKQFSLMPLLLLGPTGGPKYSGPQCLGPFCIDGRTTTHKVFQQLGSPAKKASRFDPYCYESQDGRGFLRMEVNDSLPGVVVEAFLSDFSNCEHIPAKVTADDLRAWKTREGVGLGSLESDVVKAYGKPTNRRKIDTKSPHDMNFLVRGYRSGDTVPRVGYASIWYGGAWDDLSVASFGIHDGKVCWIWLSFNE
jgi:hypothetical protein